ncbi:hypothetical protein TCON_1498 [Astathelohania contejeani]|uniref:Uncharacterized protein n=1 Tax=Astathelohania contejeani TaxID=164912 RepID=A0ABQ7HYK8_9MICR|nr:hypothetical protein TCON_1498 [Thelohania contejeani]
MQIKINKKSFIVISATFTIFFSILLFIFIGSFIASQSAEKSFISKVKNYVEEHKINKKIPEKIDPSYLFDGDNNDGNDIIRMISLKNNTLSYAIMHQKICENLASKKIEFNYELVCGKNIAKYNDYICLYISSLNEFKKIYYISWLADIGFAIFISNSQLKKFQKLYDNLLSIFLQLAMKAQFGYLYCNNSEIYVYLAEPGKIQNKFRLTKYLVGEKINNNNNEEINYNTFIHYILLMASNN